MHSLNTSILFLIILPILFCPGTYKQLYKMYLESEVHIKKIFHFRLRIKHCVMRNTCTQWKQNRRKITESVLLFTTTEKPQY